MKVRLAVIKDTAAPQLMLVEAKSVGAAAKAAQESGFTVVSAQPHEWWVSLRMMVTPLHGKQPTRSSHQSFIIWVEQFHSLLKAGLSVMESLHTLHRQSIQNRAAIPSQKLEQRLREGFPLSDALEMTGGFPALFISLVRSAELSSSLTHAFERYLDHERRVATIRHQLTSVALYPLLLMGVGSLVLMFLLFVVMPRFARIFQGMQGDLPWTAKAMVSWVQLLKDHGVAVSTGFALVGAMIVFMASSQRMRRALAKFVRKQPQLASKFSVYYLARWYRTTSLLLRGGIPLPQALTLANHVLPSERQAKGALVIRHLQSGLPPAQSYTLADMTTPVAEQLINAGQRGGDLGGMLEKAADFHDTEIARSLDRFMRIFEPVVMALIGVAIGVVVVIMYMPIFELASAIQ